MDLDIEKYYIRKEDIMKAMHLTQEELKEFNTRKLTDNEYLLQEIELMWSEFERLEDLEDDREMLKYELKKEKEKNKELENADLTTVYMNGFYDGEKKWKDKIREKMKELEWVEEVYKCQCDSCRDIRDEGRYMAYKKLLEEE